jgi:hypothetical protein
MASFNVSQPVNLTYIHVPRTGMAIKTLTFEWIQKYNSTYRVDDWMIDHPNLQMVKEHIPNGKVFTVIRNPWMRVWSLYRKISTEGYWLDWNRMKPRDLKPFNEWLEDYADPNWEFKFPRWFDRWTNMIDFIEYKDQTVDYILRAENLVEDFQVIQDLLQCKEPLPDVSMYTDEYREHYTDKGAECVYKVYERDIKRFAYEF